MAWKHADEKPDILFREHDADNPLVHRNLLDSNIFLVLVREKISNIVYYLVTQPVVKKALFNMALSHVATDESHSKFSRKDSEKAKVKRVSEFEIKKTIEEEVNIEENYTHDLPTNSSQTPIISNEYLDTSYSQIDGPSTMLMNSDIEEDDIGEITPATQFNFQESRQV